MLRGVTEDKKALLEELYPGKFSFTAYRDSFDYIYTVEELTELHGKKLQAKRNHCNRFEQDHPDFKTEIVTPENLQPLCRDMVKNGTRSTSGTSRSSRRKRRLQEHSTILRRRIWMVSC